MKQDITDIDKRIERAYKKAVELRRYIHMNPELSEHEEKTAQFISKRLSELGIEHKTGIGGNGVCGIIYGKDRNTATGIRADFDALPIEELTDVPYRSVNTGVMHACGHDIHTAVLLGTAEVLSSISDDLNRSVKLIFEPAEETIGGAKPMIDEGVMKAPDVTDVIGLHVTSDQDAGKVIFISGTASAASTEFWVTVHGRSAHGAYPEDGTDTIPCACTMVSSLQTVVTRRISPTEAALITVGQFNSGTKNNIISDKTTFSGIIRVLDFKNREVVKNELRRMVESTAEAYGCTEDVIYRDSYPNLINDDELLNTIMIPIKEKIGEENVVLRAGGGLGAEDFAYFCHEARGCYFDIGCHRKGVQDYFPTHSSRFDPDDSCIRTGIIAEVFAILKLNGLI